MAPKPLGLNTKKVPNHLRHPLEKFETKPISFDKIWHRFLSRGGQRDKPDLASTNLPT
jgi:hypothetical protein